MEDAPIRELINKFDSFVSENKSVREEVCEYLAVLQLERLCYKLKCSIIDVDLKTPEVLVFHRYLCQLTNGGDIMYVTSLLRQCWRYAHPQSLLDAPVKPLPQEELLDMALSKYSGNRSDCTAETFNAEYYALHTRLAAKNDDLSFHRAILGDLYEVIAKKGHDYSISITHEFLSRRVLISSLSQAQLSAAFDVLVSEGCTRNQDKKSFLASFDSAVQARQSQVCWLATNPKNKTVNYAKLYVLFQVLQVELSECAKSVIAETFVSADGSALKSSSLKVREDSQELLVFRDKLKKVL